LITGLYWSLQDLVNSGDSIQLFASQILNEVTIADFVSYDQDDAEDDPGVDDLAVTAGLWSNGAAVDTLSAVGSVGRAIYLLHDGESLHEADGDDEEDLDWAQYAAGVGGSPGYSNPPPPSPSPTLTPSPAPSPTPPPSPSPSASPRPSPSVSPSPTTSPVPLPTPPPPYGYRDIVINEINFAPDDANPNVELRFEYIELFNRGNVSVNLDEWYLKDESADLFTFPTGGQAVTMPPQSYLVIYSGQAEGSLNQDKNLNDGVGRLIAGTSWNNYDLTNSGDSVQIFTSPSSLDPAGLADFVSFDQDDAEDDAAVDDVAVSAGLWSNGAAIDTAGAQYSVGRAIYLIVDGRTDHEASGGDDEDLDWAQYGVDTGGSPGLRNLPITPTPFGSPLPTPSPSPTAPLGPTPQPTATAPLIDEGFDDFHLGMRPEGWTFNNCNADTDSYLNSSDFGRKAPSLKLDADGDQVVSKAFVEPGSLNFWLKGQGTDVSSGLLIEEYVGSGWSVLSELTPLPSSGTTAGPFAFNRSSTKVRFIYEKSVGNLSFDDVRILPYVPTPTPTPEGYRTPTPTPSVPPSPSATPTFTPTPSCTPTPEGYRTATPTPVPTPSVPLIDEGFNDFHVGQRPAGWTFTNCNGDTDTYTNESNCGRLLPSLKLDATGDVVVSKILSDPGDLTFWIKGQGTDELSSLLVEEYLISGWSALTDIANLPTLGTNEGPFGLNRNATAVKFSYTKSDGNLAFDDVIIAEYVPTPSPTPEGYRTPSPTASPSPTATPPPGDLEIHHIQALDSEATLIISPIGTSVLIDAAGPGQGFSVVLPYVVGALKARQRSTLDYIIASNYSPERIGGMDEVIYGLDREPGTVDDLIPVHAAYDRGWYSEGAEFVAYLAAAGAKRTAIQDNGVIDLGGGATITCLGVNGNGVISEPFLAHDVSGHDPENLYAEEDFSIAWRLTYHDFDYFSGGDLPGTNAPPPYYFHAIEPSLAQEIGAVEVYRADQRGGWYSSAQVFLDALDPAVSVLAGGPNPQGNPHPAVVERLEAAREGTGIVHRVEPDYPVVIRTGGYSYQISQSSVRTDEVNVYFSQPVNQDYVLPGGTLANGSWNVRQSFINRIRAATQSIDICMSNLGSDWTDVISELISADSNEVAIRVIVDQNVSTSPQVQALQIAGIPVQFDTTGEGNYDMHDKFALFDCGGSSTADDWLWCCSLHWLYEYPGGGDAAFVEVRNHDLAGAFQEEFELMWDSDGAGTADQARYHSQKYDHPPSQTGFVINGRLWEFFPGPRREDPLRGHLWPMREMVKHIDMTYPALVSPASEDPFDYGDDYPCQANYEFFYQIATFEWCRPTTNPNYFSPGHLYDSIERKRTGNVLAISGGLEDCGRDSQGDPLCDSCPPTAWTESFDSPFYLHQEYGISDGCHMNSSPSVFFGSNRWTVNSQSWNDEILLTIWDPLVVNQFVQDFMERREEGGRSLPDLKPHITSFSVDAQTVYDQIYPFGAEPVITINGSNFENYSPGICVRVGEQYCSIDSVSSSEIRAGFSSGMHAGEYDIEIINPNGWNDTTGGFLVYSLNPTPTPSASPTPTPSPSPTPTPTVTPSASPTPTQTPTPSPTPSASPSPSITPTPTPSPSPSVTPTPTPSPTAPPTPSPTPINPPPQITISAPESGSTITI